MSGSRQSRRKFLKYVSFGVAAAVPGGLLSRVAAASTPMAKVELDDPTAKALGYVHESPNPEQLCSNCMHIRGDEAQWRGCALFPGKLVNNDGWCKAWAAKP